MSSYEDLSDSDILDTTGDSEELLEWDVIDEIEIAPESQSARPPPMSAAPRNATSPPPLADDSIDVEVEVDHPPKSGGRVRLPRPTPPPRTTTPRPVTHASRLRDPSKSQEITPVVSPLLHDVTPVVPVIVDPVVAAREEPGASIAPVALEATPPPSPVQARIEARHAQTVHIQRPSSGAPSRWSARPGVAWTAALVLLGAAAAMSTMYVISVRQPEPAAAPAAPPPTEDDSVIVAHAKRKAPAPRHPQPQQQAQQVQQAQQPEAMRFGDDQATHIRATPQPPAAANAAGANASSTAPAAPHAHAKPAEAKAKPSDAVKPGDSLKPSDSIKVNPLIGPTLAAAPDKKPAEPKPEPKPEPKGDTKKAPPQPVSAEALMEAQLRAASR